MKKIIRTLELDLSPFRLKEFQVEEGAIQVKEPMLLTPYMSEDEQLLCLDYEAWDLMVYAPTRQELMQELQEHMEMLWIEFATEDDEILDASAKELKQRLLQDLTFTPNA